MDRARGRDAEAFGLLYVRFRAQVIALMRTRTGSVAVAEDLTSETFERAWRSIEEFRSDGRHFLPWLRRIASNLAVDHVTSGRCRFELVIGDLAAVEPVLSADGTDDAEVEGQVLRGLTDERVRRALADLSPSQRRCLTLRILEQRSIRETAEQMGCTPGAVKQLQLRGLRNLAEGLAILDARPPAEQAG